MKIGIYDPYLDDLGGGEKYMMTIAQCLSKNHNVNVFWDDQRVRDGLIQRFSLDLYSVVFQPNIFSSSFSLVKRLSESKKYDLIILLSDGSIPLLFSKKTFLHIQQPVPVVKLSVVDLIKLKKIDGIFCNSNYTKDYIDRKFKKNSKLLYPPILLNPQKIRKENMILHVGRFRVHNKDGVVDDFKKQFSMVRAFKEMYQKNNIKNWRMVFCVSVREDDAKEFELLKNEAKDFPVTFEVNKSNNDLWNYYSRAKIYWHASGFGEDLHLHPELAEHFGISTVEAMGAGAIPVVINCGGQKEIIEHGSSGYLWNSLDDLQKYTMNLINNSRKIVQMNGLVRKRAGVFASMDFCRSLQNILELK